MARAERILVLTGAGISAESGLGTFRDEGGLWAQHDIRDVATPEGFARDPALVQGFYNARRLQAAGAAPNPAHVALARLQRDWPGEVTIVTQNVDALHERAGAEVIHMHGELSRALCVACEHRWDAPPEMAPQEPCPACGKPAARPDVVWFGEMPYHMDLILEHLERCDRFAAIGTSGQVHPAAGFVQEATLAGAATIELNLESSEVSRIFHERRAGPATETVPAWVETLLASA
ncbi:NAD-dependent deacylase [Salipiger mucosus]|uniref:NAD-dependent protein deacylase n=1 Tax=Salipiger mucosus DSM 16094 TaxID=1123237 RepID=S9QVH0_9RHOB|nr:NAD-dependent deacylase [Salipiger mucosus]EPX85421.1 NAD-dependent protein deacetylase of SIR2 family [Salipiger mucosus DSM 16094]